MLGANRVSLRATAHLRQRLFSVGFLPAIATSPAIRNAASFLKELAEVPAAEEGDLAHAFEAFKAIQALFFFCKVIRALDPQHREWTSWLEHEP